VRAQRGVLVTKWKRVARGLWVGEYTNGSNVIHTSVVDMGDGSLMAISPGTGMSDADFDELDALGPVKALVSPGAFHHLGMPSWKARYPDAPLFGPQSSIAHIKKQQPGLEAVQGFDALRPLLSDEFDLGEVDACRHPDIFLALTRDGQTSWFTNELLTNNADWPSSFVFRWVFKLTGNAPGLQANTLTAMFIGAKKPLVKAFYEAKVKSCPPTRLMPCHGDVLEDDTLGERIVEVLGRRF